MKDINSISKARVARNNLSKYKDLIETVSKVEFQKISNLGLIDLSEVINLANYTVYNLMNCAECKIEYNAAYLAKAIKWAVRNEMRRRYKWYTMKNTEHESDKKNVEEENIRDAVYKTILSIEEMAEAENPTIIKDLSRNPEEKAEIIELKRRIYSIMETLSEREKELIEAKYVYDKKLKDIQLEFNISQSRISRIIQHALDKIKCELLKQEEVNENNI